MPNHFHLLVHVNRVSFTAGFTEQVTPFEQRNIVLHQSNPCENSHLLSKTRSLNDSTGIILRSYTRAIQKQEGYTGSLFQNRTKAICLTLPEDLSPAYFQTSFGVIVHIDVCEKEYPQVCFDYIHSNPVNAGLVKLPEQWEFSSAKDDAG